MTPFLYMWLFVWNNEIVGVDESSTVESIMLTAEIVKDFFGSFFVDVIVLSIIPVTIYFVKKIGTFWAVRQTILTGCPTKYVSSLVATIYIFFAVGTLFYGVVHVPEVSTVINQKIVLWLIGSFAAAVPNIGMGMGLIYYKGRMETLCTDALPAPSRTSPPAP